MGHGNRLVPGFLTLALEFQFPADFFSNPNQTHLNKLSAVSENLGSWLVALLPYQAMTLQAAFVHEGSSNGQTSEEA